MALAQEQITVCRRGTAPLEAASCAALLQQLPDWQLAQHIGMQVLQRSYSFKDFAAALAFANAVGAAAEAADHHPRMVVEWGKVELQWWTHTVQGLHSNDFIMAARCDQLLRA